MKRRIFLALVVLMTLIFASCSMSDMYQEKNIASSAYIKIELSDSSRTALPVINRVEDFTSFTLTDNTRSTANVVHVMDQSWETDSSGTALEKMAATKIAVTEGALYSFTLSAQKGGALWQGTVSKTMESGVNSLSFELELKSFPVSGYGSLEVTLTVPSIVSAVDAVLKSYNEGSVKEPQDATLSFADGKATYTASNIYASYYVLVFTLWGDTDKTLKLGEWREYARIAADMLSKSAPVIESADDLNRIYRVTFNTNGGSEVLSQTVAGGNPVTRPEINPTKATDEVAIYTFENWYTSSDGGTTLSATAYKFSTPITGDITLYAKWTETAEPHTITFNSNGGTAVNSQTVDYYQKATKPANPKKSTSATAKYTFENWYTSTDNGATLSETPFDFDTPVIEDIALYAKWNVREAELYPITIAETENGSINIEEAFAEPGDIITINITPAKTDEAYYKLEGVSVKCGGTDITVTDNTFIMPAGNITVSATFIFDKVVYSIAEFFQALGGCENIMYDPDAEPGISIYPGQSSAKCVNKVVLRCEPGERLQFGQDSLISADLRGLDTSNFTHLNRMFSENRRLESVVLSNIAVTSMFDMFEDCMHLESVVLSNIDVTNMAGIFNGCSSLKSVDISILNSSKVTNMSYMFKGCSSLTSINISNLDTSNVTDMSYMFYGCSKLSSLDLSNFDTSKVTNMSHMFDGIGLTSIDLSNFDTSKVTDMSYMFSGTNFTSIDLSNFDTSKVTDMSYMFSYAALTSIDLSNFDTSNVTNMSHMFYECPSVATVDLSNLDTGKVTDMNCMFCGCTSLTSVALSNIDISEVTDMSYMFCRCSGLTSVDLSNLNKSSVTNMYGMFYKCTSLTSVNLSNFDTSKVTNMNNMFYGCKKLKTINLSNIDTSEVTDMSNMFYECTSLTSLNLSNIDTSKVTNMNSMFYGCASLTSLDLSNLNTSKVADMEKMFYNCTGLTSVALSNYERKTLTSLNNMFCGCSSLTSVNLSNFSTFKVVGMSGMFKGCSSLATLDLSNFDTSKITDMSNMFYGCSSLATLDLSSFDTSKVTSMYRMFYECSKLSTLDISSFDTSSVTNMGYMFYDCAKLTTLDLSNFDTSSINNMNNIFNDCFTLKTIYVSNKFVEKPCSAAFLHCYALEGGSGTKYNWEHIESDYAHIDGGESNPGYFTAKP